MTPSTKAFTLIELLIVVAIIAILAAIAVPNFLEAQTRAKVSRVKSDQRTVATALESYYVDNNSYPPTKDKQGVPQAFANLNLTWLTTPVSYITSTEATADPFMQNIKATNTAVGAVPVDQNNFYYVGYADFSTVFAGDSVNVFKGWGLSSLGPDADDNGTLNGPWLIMREVNAGRDPSSMAAFWVTRVYDPTNGTVSLGDITRLGGEMPSATQVLIN